MRIVDFLKMHRVMAAVILIDLIIVIVIVVMAVLRAGKTATIDVLTVPSIAKVRIGGDEYESGAYKIYPGDYEVEVEADGFVAKTVPVVARAGEISKVYVYLTPEEGNLSYYAEHEDDWYNMKRMNDEEAQRVYKLLSIRDELPMEYIEQSEDGDEGLSASKYIVLNKSSKECIQKYYCLRVATIFDKNEDVVRFMLEEKGFNIDDYGIEWTIYTGETMDGDALLEMREGEWGY